MHLRPDYRTTSRQRRWAGLAAAVSAIGALVAALLTWVKFGSDFRCDVDFLSGCSRFGDCSRVFASGPSSFFDVPVTAAATAFYVVATAVQLSIAFDRRWFYGVERELAGLSGWLTVYASIAMAAYAGVVLHTFCIYCSSLYFISIVYCAAAHGSTGTRLAEMLMHIGRLRWLGTGRGMRAGVLATALGMTSWSAEAFVYDVGRRTANPGEACTVDITDIPPPALVSLGGENADVVFHEVIDLSCGHCRDQWQELHEIVGNSAGRVRVEYHLFPREPGDQYRCAPRGFEPDASSQLNQSCYAGLALACAAKTDPKRANRFLELLFQLQERRAPPFFEPAHVLRAALEAGLPVSADNPASSDLGRCIEADEEVFTLMYRTVKFAMDQGIRSTPRLYAVRCTGGACDTAHAIQVQGAKHERFLESLAARMLGGPTTNADGSRP